MRIVVFALLLTPTIVSAEPAPAATTSTDATYTLGVRVGGYGFRREGDTSANAWTQCRMNGFGLFGDRALKGPFFVEGGLDIYFSQSFPTPDAPASEVATDLPIDRSSIIASTAIGARTRFTSWLRGFAQVGAGLELTRVSVPYGDRDTIRDQKALPEAFLGFGADIRIGSGTFIGASMRMHVMGNFDYDPQRLQMGTWVSEPTPSEVFSASPSLAAQGQFYLRREL